MVKTLGYLRIEYGTQVVEVENYTTLIQIPTYRNLQGVRVAVYAAARAWVPGQVVRRLEAHGPHN